MLRSLFIATCVALTTATASAQVADWREVIQPTLPSNESLVLRIRATMPAGDIATLTSSTADTIAIGEDLQHQLEAALAIAPDDAARSRIAGVLTHTQAALAALRMASNEANLDAARGRLEQARGEAQESLDELRPFVMAAASAPVAASAPAPVAASAPVAAPAAAAPVAVALPATLPLAGSIAPAEIAGVPLLGLSLLLLGLTLRRAGTRPR
jgi:hypothetical protein